jgi:type I restriction enzyme S subunit
MKSNLKFFKLGEVAKISAGGDKPKILSQAKVGKYQIPVFANGETNNGLQGFTDKAKITEPSVTVSARGTIGYAVLRNEPFVPIVRLLTLIPDSKKIDLKYLYYYLTLFRQAGLGSSQAQLTVPDLSNRKISVLDLQTQEEIGKILSLLDRKIELNNKINNELEAMAKTLYDYWFVQFDFPDKNGKPYKSSGGEMYWSDQLNKEIPKRWKVEKVKNLILADKSGDWGKDERSGNYVKEVFCIRGADINNLNGKDQCLPPKRFILEKNSHKLLDSYDLIVEISGGSPIQSTGRIAYISNTKMCRFSKPLICSNFCKAITLKNKKLTYNFYYFWNRMYDGKVFFGFEGKTSGIKNLLFDNFVDKNYIVVPDNQTMDVFFEFMEKIEEKKQKTLEENQKLYSLRDWLLPMLMNGQVTIN